MKDDLDDLSARARRGLLVDAELRELERRLEGSHEANLAHRAGCEFDAEDLVLAGDEALVARINQRLLGGRGRQRRPRFRAIALVIGGVCTTVAAAAAGPGLVEGAQALWVRSFGYQEPFQAAPAAPGPQLAPPNRSFGTEPPTEQRVAPASSAPALPAPLASSLVRAVAEPPARPAPTTHAPDTQALLPAASAQPAAETSASLFAQASLARRQGNLREAMALYARLPKRFPGTAEADSAEVALGTLSLQSGMAAQALVHFERYLAARPGGQLAIDALWGKTRALQALGREDEARRDLQLLVTRYPRSTYATAARATLGQPP